MIPLVRRLLEGSNDARISYDEACALARHDDPDVRRRLAERPDTMPEILYFLAEDPDPRVRPGQSSPMRGRRPRLMSASPVTMTPTCGATWRRRSHGWRRG